LKIKENKHSQQKTDLRMYTISIHAKQTAIQSKVNMYTTEIMSVKRERVIGFSVVTAHHIFLVHFT